SVQTSKELLPNIPHGVLAGLAWANVTDEQLEQFATYADFFNPNLNIVTDELVNRVHHAGMEIYSYTVRTQKQADKLFNHGVRSEEHTSELQSRFDLVCRLLLEKKKK